MAHSHGHEKKVLRVVGIVAAVLLGLAAVVGICVYTHPIWAVGLGQKLVYGDRANLWEPLTEAQTFTQDGVTCRTELRYGDTYPNSYLDVYTGAGEDAPTYLYLHGGGYVGGDKSMGDPLADGSGATTSQAFYTDLVAAGYNVATMNYALAPEYTFPVQMEQISQALRYLTDAQDTLGLNMERVVIGGGSAGAMFTAVYGCIVTDPSYAEAFGVAPAINPEQLKAVVIDDAPFLHEETRTFVLDAIHSALFGTTDFEGKWGTLAKVPRHVTEAYPPAFLCPGNAVRGEDTFGFEPDLRELSETLDAQNVPNELFFLDKSHGDLPHSYLFNQHGLTDAADQAFRAMIDFLNVHCSE